MTCTTTGLFKKIKEKNKKQTLFLSFKENIKHFFLKVKRFYIKKLNFFIFIFTI